MWPSSNEPPREPRKYKSDFAVPPLGSIFAGSPHLRRTPRAGFLAAISRSPRYSSEAGPHSDDISGHALTSSIAAVAGPRFHANRGPVSAQLTSRCAGQLDRGSATPASSQRDRSVAVCGVIAALSLLSGDDAGIVTSA